MKRSRRLFWLAGLCVLVGVGICVVVARSREVRYQGKTAADWFRELRSARAQSVRRDLMSQAPAEDPDALLATARSALITIGTNAAIYLAKEIRRGDSHWSVWYRTKLTRWPPAVRRLLPNPPERRDGVQSDAAFALLNLGNVASAAIPVLIEGLKDLNPDSRRHCMSVLGTLDFDRARIDVVLLDLARCGRRQEALDIARSLGVYTSTSAILLSHELSDPHPGTRFDAAVQFRTFGSMAKSAAPQLGRALRDINSDVRNAAAYVLDSLGPDAVAAVPELVTALRSEDDEVRCLSSYVLGRIGRGAVEAVPALIVATNDAEATVRSAALRALEYIHE